MSMEGPNEMEQVEIQDSRMQSDLDAVREAGERNEKSDEYQPFVNGMDILHERAAAQGPELTQEQVGDLSQKRQEYSQSFSNVELRSDENAAMDAMHTEANEDNEARERLNDLASKTTKETKTEEPKSSFLGRKARALVQGIGLGAGLLAGEAAVNRAEAQAPARIENAKTLEDTNKVLMERGSKTPGVVFEEGKSLYIVMSGSAADLQAAIDNTERLARRVFGLYLLKDKPGVSDLEIHGSKTISQKTEMTNAGGWKVTILMEMPKP